MAIIRKGDKVAEEALKKRAVEQNRNRMMASDEKKRKAGLEFAGTKRVTKKADGKTKATKLSTKKSIRTTKSEVAQLQRQEFLKLKTKLKEMLR